MGQFPTIPYSGGVDPNSSFRNPIYEYCKKDGRTLQVTLSCEQLLELSVKLIKFCCVTIVGMAHYFHTGYIESQSGFQEKVLKGNFSIIPAKGGLCCVVFSD